MLLLLEYLFSLNANTLIIFVVLIPFWKNVISRVLYHKYIGLLYVKKSSKNMSIVVLLKDKKVLNKSTHFPLTEINYQYLLLICSEIFKKTIFNKLYL